MITAKQHDELKLRYKSQSDLYEMLSIVGKLLLKFKTVVDLHLPAKS